MTGAVALSTPAESSQFDRFREAEAASLAAKPLGLDEMIDRLLAESHSLELMEMADSSSRVAEAISDASCNKEACRETPAPIEKNVYTISEFCELHSISQSFYHKYKDRKPKELRLQGRVVITKEAAKEWREKMEASS